MPYQEYIFPDKLVSPITGHVCRKVNRQNVKKFGFDSVDDLKRDLPDFPLMCEEIAQVYLVNGRRASNISAAKQRQSALDRRVIKSCQSCGEILTTKHQKRYCSRSCSAKVNLPNIIDREKQKATIRATFRNRYLTDPKGCLRCAEVLPYERRERKLCKQCHTAFGRVAPTSTGGSKKSLQKYPLGIRVCQCGEETGSLIKKYCGKCRTNIRHYRSLCNFNFNVYDYPDDFDLSLIDAHGWYSPNGYRRRNKNPNLGGVSRDHLFNVAQGYAEDCDPTKLGHPANCRLLVHNGAGGNNSKKQSSITWEQLLERVAEWDAKH